MKIFVAGLPLDMDDDELFAIFSDHGKVTSARVILDRATGQSRGFAFVEMPNENEARETITALHRATIEGKEMTVRPAEDKTRDTYRNKAHSA